MSVFINRIRIFSFRRYAFRLIILTLILNFIQTSVQGQYVFYDNFNRTQATGSGGNPSLTYSSTGTSGNGVISISGSRLQIANGSTAGRQYVTGTLSSYSSPFNPQLRSNTDTIIWAFNAQMTPPNGAIPGGFTNGNFGMAVVLTSTNANLASTSSNTGYAVVYGGSGFRNFRLVRFSSGLGNSGAGALTNVINSGANDFDAADDVVSVQVRYHPASEHWTLLTRDNNASWTNPLSGTLTQRGTATNSNNTGNNSTAFGFFFNYTNNNDPNVIARFDDFSVRIRSTTASAALTAFPSTAINFGNQWINTASFARSFDLYGSRLTSNVTVNAPTHFQVCTDTTNPANWASSLTLNINNGVIIPTTIYVRFRPTSPGPQSGTISFTGGGGTGYPTISVSGICNTAHTWQGGGLPADGVWTIASHWASGIVPIDGDSVIFINSSNGANYSVDSLPANITLRGITLLTGANVNFTSLSRASTIRLSNPGTALNINSGSTLILRNQGANAITLSYNRSIGTVNNANIAGTLQVGWTGATTNGGLANYNADSSTTTVSGTLIATGPDAASNNRINISSSSSNLIFENGGSFSLQGTALLIPQAKWNSNSTCNIKNKRGGTLSVSPQPYHHFVVDCDMGINRSAITMDAGSMDTIRGDLRLNKTGWDGSNTQAFRINGSNNIINIYGKLIIRNDSELEFTNNTNTINLYGDSLHIDGNGHLRPAGTAAFNLNFVRSAGIQYYFCSSDTGLVFVPGRPFTIRVGNGTSTTNTLILSSTLKMTNTSSMTVLSGSTLDCGTNFVRAVTASGGSFTVNPDGTLRMGSPDGITLSPTYLGNIRTNSRTFNTGANYGYYGNVPQSTGDALPATVNDLTIENSGGGSGVTLVNSVTVNNNLRLNNGRLTTGPDTVNMNNFSQINGGVSTISSSSYVNGYLTSSFRTGSYTRTIPIGDATNYTPIGITVTNITTQGRLTTHTIASDNPNISRSNFNPSRTVNRHWIMSNAGIALSSYGATFNYVNADKDAGVNSLNVYAGRYSGTSWTYPTMGTLGTTSAVVSGITAGFGDFQLGECVTGTGAPDPDSAVASKTIICSGESVTLSLWRGGLNNIENVGWYADSCRGTLIASGNNISLNPTETTTYYGRFEGSSSCTTPSNCRSVTITVNPSPQLNIFTPDPACNFVDLTDPSITSGSDLQGGTLQYFTNAAATNTLSNPQAVGTSGTYYIRGVSAAGCPSFVLPVNVDIIPSPSLTINGNAFGCSPALADLTQASLTAGSVLNGATLSYWNDPGASGSPVSTPSAVNSGTYYIRASNSQCSDVKQITAEIFNTNLIITPPSPVCAAAPASFNLTQSSLTTGSSLNGASLFYYTDRNYSSAVSNPSAVGTGKYFIKAEVTSAGCNDRDSVDIVVREFGQWIGVNTNWNDAQNWCGGVPTSTRDVTIPSGLGNYPVLSSGAEGFARNITMAAGSSLTVNGKTLKVYGNISGNRAINMTDGTLEMAGSSLQNFGGLAFTQATVKNLIISNPAGVNLSSAAADSLRITRKLSFGNVNNSKFNTGNNLILVSDANGTASVADITNNGANSGDSIVGNVTVERYIAQARKWQFLSIPTNTTQSFKESWMEGANSISENPRPGFGTIITDNRTDWQTRGFDAQSPGGPSVKMYNPVTGDFDAISSTSTGISTNFGYMAFIRGDRLSQPSNSNRNPTVLRTKGPLKQGTQASIPVADSSFVSIGNPFASAIDMRKISKPGCPNAFYIWDPNLAGTYGLGRYQTFNLGGFDTATGIAYYVPIPGGGSYGANLEPFNQIQSGQAFFIRGGIGGSIQLKENDKLPDSTRQVMRPGRVALPIIRPGLYSIVNNSTILEDGCGIFFNDNFSNEIGHEDAVKLNNTGVNVTIKRNGQFFAVEGRKSVGENDTFFINISGLRQATYEWDVNMQNMQAPGRIAFLIDNFSGARTRLNLDGANAYRFSVTQEPASSDPGRFMIVFRQPAYIPLEFTHFSGSRIEKRIDLSWRVMHENGNWKYEIERSGEDGIFKSLAENRQEASGTGVSLYSFSDNDPFNGNNHYRIKAKDAFGHFVYSEKILIEENNLNEFVSIRPNPVTGKKIRLFFSRPQSGKYRIELTNNSGINILSGEYTLLTGNRELLIPLSEKIPAGNYFIHVSGISNGSKSVLKLIIM